MGRATAHEPAGCITQGEMRAQTFVVGSFIILSKCARSSTLILAISASLICNR